MSQRFEKLLEPGMIGHIKTRNRMLKTANGTSYVEDDQTCGERMITYYERLAKGGVGFLVVESCGTEYPLGIQHAHYDADGNLIRGVQLHLDDDKYIDGFARLTERVHKHGCPVSVQFQHAGPWNPTGLLPKTRDTCAASAIPEDELPGPDFNPPRAYTKQEVEDQVDKWASAAERAYKAGFDACEINHGTCHQGATFLSRVWNRREDEYGAQNYENRTRFLRNCITEAKRRCGKNFTVHCLFNAREYNHPLGITIEEGVEMAVRIAEVADGINVRGERFGHRNGILQPDRILYPVPPDDLPEGMDWSRGGIGATVPFVEAIKKRVKNIPVWTACRLDPVTGEEYLQKGSIDFVGMTRRLLADPELPNKVIEGRLEDIRWCNGCLWCFHCRNKNQKMECRVNASLGKELWPEFKINPITKKKKVMVVGGGPAGMETARVASKRGHEVTLYEKGHFLGGLIPCAAVIKDLETNDLTVFVKYMETQLKKQGVKIYLKKEVTPELIKSEKPDALVIAAGAAHTKIDLPGSNNIFRFVPTPIMHNMLKFFLRFFTPAQMEILSRIWIPVRKSVVVMGGELHGCELAEYLVKRRKRVTIVHDGPEAELGKDMTDDDLANLWPWLRQNNVSIWSNVKYERVAKEGLWVSLPDRRKYIMKGKNVMTTQDWGPNQKIEDQFKGLVSETYLIGSAREPGFIVNAMQDGHKMGLAL
ncbi:MAG: FAD-dependent oxidoreductase [Deltaproteobacteria bacterium]|nr:FAD-dependent oxidoreductase [Deltaproteobacteria bacterium]